MTPARSNPVKHPQFYFPDGNIVLSAFAVQPYSTWLDELNLSGGPATVLFRVHKSVCAAHSSVFDNMFLVSDGRESSKHDGACDLTDSEKEVEVMLSAIYGQSNWLPQDGLRLHGFIDTTLLLLSMIKKYDLSIIRNQLADYLCLEWPTSLEELDGSKQKFSRMNPAFACVLARELNIPIVRAVSLYALSRFDSPSFGETEVNTEIRWDLLSGSDFRALYSVEKLKNRNQIIDGSLQIIKYKNLCSFCTRGHHMKDPKPEDKIILKSPDLLLSTKRYQFFTEHSSGMNKLCSIGQEKIMKVLKARQEQFWKDLVNIAQRELEVHA